MTITLPDLPYAKNALIPHISANTLEFHHGKHHAAYVNNLNALLEKSELKGNSLENIIKATAEDQSKTSIFNNAAQVWNHTFYWHSMKPNGGGEPSRELSVRLKKDFGSVESFVADFKKAGITQFGSGWVWVCLDIKADKLIIVKTKNAETPLSNSNLIPLMTCDVWEHAYYLDYQNKRPDYLSIFFDSLVNWDFMADNLEK